MVEKKRKKLKMNEEIEEYCWYLWENGKNPKEYLLSLGFNEDEIEYFLEVWREGKSLYPY